METDQLIYKENGSFLHGLRKTESKKLEDPFAYNIHFLEIPGSWFTLAKRL